MLISAAIDLRLLMIVYGLVIIAMGAAVAYMGFIGIIGKYKPNGWQGANVISFSRHSRLLYQDKYWYEINRYAGKKTQYLAILIALLGVAVIVLPVDPQLMMISSLVMLLVLSTLGLIVIGVLTYRYAESLIPR